MQDTTKEIEQVQTELNYNEALLLETVRAEKYSNEVKRSFALSVEATGFQLNVKREIMLELAEEYSDKQKISNLIRNGWEASGKNSAGSGIAIKGEKKGEWFECIVYEGAIGKPFNSSEITAKHYIKLNAKHLEALFTHLLFDKKAFDKKVEAEKHKRTSLDLG